VPTPPPNLQQPWNNWYHLIGHTYGTWLPGDPRGFRTLHHRQHITGDYKSPPPKGKYSQLRQYSKSVMKRDPIYLNRDQRQLATRFLVESLQRREIEVVSACTDSLHFHILAKIIDNRPDHWMGIAKRETSRYIKDAGMGYPGGLWGARGKSQPIKNRAHQLSTVKYILNHRTKGASVWFRGKLLPPIKA
jgi:REP element-mobilizing transposase RayT